MKLVVVNWAKDLVRSTIMGNIEDIEKEVGSLQLSTSKSGGTLRMYKITGIIARRLPIVEFLSLNNEAVLTNAFILKHKEFDDIKTDALLALMNSMLSVLPLENKVKAEDQIEALANKLVLGYSKILATKENESKRDNGSIELIKKKPLLLSIFAISIYKDAIFSVILKVVEEIYGRRE